MFKAITGYFLKNKLIAAVGLYFVVSSILKLSTGIDICIPCIWKSIFGFQCPGCGLTTAFIDLLKLDFKGAYGSNRLIYIVAPAVLYFIITDLRKELRIKE